MDLKSLSASSAETYENCPAQWKANYVDGREVQDVASSAADLGTACHEALEICVRDMLDRSMPAPDRAVMLEAFDAEYWRLFTTSDRLDEGIAMLDRWLARSGPEYWAEREVLHLEEKKTFFLPTSAGKVPVNFIWDRCDRLPDGSIEVIDYKTYVAPLQPSELQHRIQARLYSTAARLEYPEADRHWVTFDLLRYDTVGTVFSVADDRETWRYLGRLAERILSDADAPERVNGTCHWCVRRHECDALKAHVALGGVLGVSEPSDAAKRLEGVQQRLKALRTLERDLTTFLIDSMKNAGVLELPNVDDAGLDLAVEASGTRKVDAGRVAALLGPEILSEKGDISISAVDELLKGDRLSDDEKEGLRGLIYRQVGSPRLKMKRRKKF